MAGGGAEFVDSVAEIDLLASPIRIEIIDTLEALGQPASVAELAAELGRPADGLYYHLRPLVDVGLVEEESAADGRRYRTRTGPEKRLRLHYRPGDTPTAKAVGRAAASQLRMSGRDFERALADPASVVDGAQRELWAARSKGWVDAEELAEINRLLARVLDLLHRPKAACGDKLIALSWIMAPLAPQPARRTVARKPASPTPRKRSG